MTEKVLYLCDPAMNPNCRKIFCYQSVHGKQSGCRMTENPDFARRNLNGEPVIWEIHYYEGDVLARIEPKNRRTEIQDEIAIDVISKLLSRYFRDDIVDEIVNEVRDTIMEKRVME